MYNNFIQRICDICSRLLFLILLYIYIYIFKYKYLYVYIRVARYIPILCLEGSPLPHTHPQRRDSGFMVKGLYSWKKKDHNDARYAIRFYYYSLYHVMNQVYKTLCSYAIFFFTIFFCRILFTWKFKNLLYLYLYCIYLNS